MKAVYTIIVSLIWVGCGIYFIVKGEITNGLLAIILSELIQEILLMSLFRDLYFPPCRVRRRYNKACNHLL